MSLKRSVMAAAAASAITFGALGAGAPAASLQAAQAATVTAAQAAGTTPVGTVKAWDARTNPPISKLNGEPEPWTKQVDHKNVLSYKVFSPSMNRDIPIAVVPATDAAGNRVQNAPIIYLLNGAGGAAQNQDWLSMFETKDFFAGKGVNVVIPQDGAFSYYTDWVTDPSGKYINGPQKWETFLTKELPGPIERTLNADNRRAIVGFSMSGTSALVLPQHNPGFYDAAASFSGCASTSSPQGYNYARVTVNRASWNPNFQSVTPEQMWGPMGGAYNRHNDALLGAEKLRGTDLYISTATGLAGRPDQVSYLMGMGAPELVAQIGAAQLQVEGGVIEAAINQCNHDLRAKLEGLNIPATYEFRNVGTHSWPYWREDIQKAWSSTIAPSFGL